MVSVEPPQPGVVHFGSRPSWMPVSTQAVMTPWTPHAFAREGEAFVTTVTVIRGDGQGRKVGRSRVASLVPVSTLRHKSSRSERASSSWTSRFCGTAVERVETRLERPRLYACVLSQDRLARSVKAALK